MGKLTPTGHERNAIITLDYDFIRGLGDDKCLYCLSDQQVAVMRTLSEYLGWRTRWFSLIGTPIDQVWIEQFKADIGVSFMSDACTDISHKLDHIVDLLDEIKVDFDLSQAGQDLALAALATDLTGISGALALVSTAVAGIATIVTSTQGTVNEMSDDVDNIETIVTASASEITETGADVDNIELLVEKMGNKQTTIINNTTINVSLTLPNQTFTLDTSDRTATEMYARYNALCGAIVSWILLEGYALLDALGAGPSDLASLKVFIDAEVFYYSYLLNPAAPAFSQTTILAAMVDSAAVDDVACALITYLADLPPTYANFIAAMDAYIPPALPDNRAVIHDTLVIALDSLDAWTGFAPILETTYQQQLALNPTGYNCLTCGPTSGCGYQAWDFTIGQKAPWIIHRGIYVPGQGIVGVQAPGDPGYAFDIEINFAAPGCIPVPAGTNRIHFFVQGIPANAWNAWQYEAYHLVSGVETLFSATQWPTASYSYPTGYQQNDAWPNIFGAFQDITRLRFHSNTQFLYPAGGNWVTPTYSAVTGITFAAT